ncbi:MAG: hypothetical protein EA403_01515 [Spirochaetaceae bacterium]|nr:MAG: hypothetical protein EA403_01515 [Spirochaetaceae bacterium]
MKKRTLMLGAAAALLAAVPLAADPPPVGVPGGGWHEWAMNIDELNPPQNTGLDRHEFRELLDTIQTIGMLFRRMPSLNPPVGTEILPCRSIYSRVGMANARSQGPGTEAVTAEVHPLKIWPGDGHQGEEGKGPLRGEFAIRIFRPEFHFRNPSSTVRVQFNDPWLVGRMVFEDEKGGMYLLHPSAPEPTGMIRFQTDRNTIVRLILPPGRDVWVPVSQERWISHLIARSASTLEERRATYVDGADERRARFMRGYESMRRMNAEQAATMLRNFEATEEVYARQAAAIAAEDFDALETAGERGLAMVGRHMKELRAELAGLSPAQRAAPAYGFEQNPHMYWMPSRTPRRPSLLMDQSDRNALPLLAPNPDFFRRDLPAGSIQAIAVVDRLWTEYHDAMNAEFDWDGLMAMVR